MRSSYHIQELKIALLDQDRGDSPLVETGAFRRVLDIGCGAGQTLIALGCREANCVGVDVDLEGLQLGKTLARNIGFVCASGEKLPFGVAQFDFVISRVALPYMNIPKVLTEISRVLEPGGKVWLLLHTWETTKNRLRADLKELRWKDAIYCVYIVLNSLTLLFFGFQWSFPLNRSRCESFQTNRSISQALSKRGFVDITIRRARFFVVSARKPTPHGSAATLKVG